MSESKIAGASGDVYDPSKDEINAFIRDAKTHPNYGRMCELKKISMLHEDVLHLLHELAATTSGGILEIGPYIGGSTIAIALAIKAHLQRPFISIETGGKNPNHELATEDIFQDLRKNVQSWGVSNYVTLINDHSNSEAVIKQVHTEMSSDRIGLLFIDADGYIERDINNYRSLLKPGSFIGLDDYSMPDMVVRDPAGEKTTLVKTAVDKIVREGMLEPLGVFGWGTWFGRYRG